MKPLTSVITGMVCGSQFLRQCTAGNLLTVAFRHNRTVRYFISSLWCDQIRVDRFSSVLREVITSLPLSSQPTSRC